MSLSRGASSGAEPANVTFEQAALAHRGNHALQALRDKGGFSGAEVLINGASEVWYVRVQIAKSFGAEVDRVMQSKNVAMVRSSAQIQVMITPRGFYPSAQR